MSNKCNWTLCGIFLFISSCNVRSKACITYGTASNKNEIIYFAKGVDEVDGYKFYDLLLVVTNYQNKSMKPYDFMQIAKSYLDTVPMDLPIGIITFVGQKKGGCLPSVEFNEEAVNKHSIITFYYNNLTQSDSESDANVISSMHLWYNGKPGGFIKLNNLKTIDSLTHSIEFIDNGF